VEAVVGVELGRDQAAAAGEGDLAEPDHAAVAGHEAEGQEDDRQGDAAGGQTEPVVASLEDERHEEH
jgi:hypothetical protein